MSWDPGLAAHRTALAWRRTGLSLMVCGGAVARGVDFEGTTRRPRAGVAVLALGVGLWLLANRGAARRAQAMGTDRPAATRADLWPMSLATALAGVAGAVIFWFV
jgi:uncharacterized membrane protein YidH (DUF202 family)